MQRCTSQAISGITALCGVAFSALAAEERQNSDGNDAAEGTHYVPATWYTSLTQLVLLLWDLSLYCGVLLAIFTSINNGTSYKSTLESESTQEPSNASSARSPSKTVRDTAMGKMCNKFDLGEIDGRDAGHVIDLLDASPVLSYVDSSELSGADCSPAELSEDNISASEAEIDDISVDPALGVGVVSSGSFPSTHDPDVLKPTAAIDNSCALVETAQLSPLASAFAEQWQRDQDRSASCVRADAADVHYRGECKPCAYFWTKLDSCRRASECEFCHLCDPGAVKRRRKQKIQRLKLERQLTERQLTNRDAWQVATFGAAVPDELVVPLLMQPPPGLSDFVPHEDPACA